MLLTPFPLASFSFSLFLVDRKIRYPIFNSAVPPATRFSSEKFAADIFLMPDLALEILRTLCELTGKTFYPNKSVAARWRCRVREKILKNVNIFLKRA